jgi:hypothetical protein
MASGKDRVIELTKNESVNHAGYTATDSPKPIKHRQVISDEVMANKTHILAEPPHERFLISKRMFLSCLYVLDTDTPNTGSGIEIVICLYVTCPVIIIIL